MNNSLRTAMANVRMTQSQLAAVCGVDPKTVGRWLLDAGRVPYVQHRLAASDALGVEVGALWPSAAQTLVKTGPDRELVALYPHRSDAPTSLWRQLIAKADSELTFAGYTGYFLWFQQANLGGLLRRKAAAGCRVRFILGDPDSPITRQREIEEDEALTLSTRIAVTISQLQKLRDTSIEARYGTGHVNLSVFRFDDQMIVTPLLFGRVGADAPMYHFQRRQDDGVFDQHLEHVEALWGRGRDVWTIPEVQQHAEA